MYGFGNKLNRSYTMHLPFDGTHCEVALFFNKANSFVGFNLDSSTYSRFRNDDAKLTIFNNLNKSAFATTFLDLRNFSGKTLDIKNQFHNIQSQFRDKIHYETNETIKLAKVVVNGRKELESCLFVYVFRFTDYGNSFLYCLAERQHIDIDLGKKIVRTSAMQLCTNETNEVLMDLIQVHNKEAATKKQDVNTAVRDVFSTRKSLTTLGRLDG